MEREDLDKLDGRVLFQIIPIESQFVEPLFDPDPVKRVGCRKCFLGYSHERLMLVLGERLGNYIG